MREQRQEEMKRQQDEEAWAKAARGTRKRKANEAAGSGAEIKGYYSIMQGN